MIYFHFFYNFFSLLGKIYDLDKFIQRFLYTKFKSLGIYIKETTPKNTWVETIIIIIIIIIIKIIIIK